MIKPTIGRVVWYHDKSLSDQACDAHIIYVHDDTKVNLAVFDMYGKVHQIHEAFLFQGEGNPPRDKFAEWMPYQQGQAAKTESLEKQLTETKPTLVPPTTQPTTEVKK